MSLSQSIGSKARIARSKHTGGYPVMQGAIVLQEVGQITCVQMHTRADGTPHELVTLAYPKLGNDSNRLFIVSSDYVEVL
jgi:hypothetical protein